jgi:hypothetical protein
MYYSRWDGSTWSLWQSLGGIFTSIPSAVVQSSDHLDVFGIGTNGAMYHKAYTPAGWQANWESLGGVFTSAPTVVSVSSFYPVDLRGL